MEDNNYCIYVHTNKINGKKYYGITKDVNARWGVDGSRYIDSSCKAFSSAIKKYGWSGFEHTILKSGLTKEQACKLEKEYIALDKTNICRYGNSHGYNMTDGGDGVCGGYDKTGENNPFYGKKHSVETKKLISEVTLGHRSGVNNPAYGREISCSERTTISLSVSNYYMSHECKTRRPVYCITDDKWFESVSDASQYYGISPGLISGCCTGNAMSTHGKMFTYNSDGSPTEYRGSYATTRRHSCGNSTRCNAVPVVCVETGAIFANLSEAALYAGLKHTGGIRKSCQDNRRMSGGFHWRYI